MYLNVGLQLVRGLLGEAVKNIADLNRPVVAPAEQIERVDSDMRANLMKNRSFVIAKKPFNFVENLRRQLFE